MLTSDLIDAAQMLLKFGVQHLAAGASDNVLRAINALRCLLTSAGENIWNFLASAYWLIASLGYQADVDPYLDIAYQNVCTCQEDAKGIAMLFGGGEKAVGMLTGCSEYAGNKKLDVDAKKEEYITKVKEANVKAVEEAAEKKRTEAVTLELETVMARSGEYGLAKEATSAFEAYQQAAQKSATSTKHSQLERVELERARQRFEATKKARTAMLRTRRRTVMRQ